MLNKEKEESILDTTFDISYCYSEIRDCPNHILDSEDMAAKLKEVIIKHNFIKRIHNSPKPLLPHQKFKIGIAGCPNGCSGPQIKDLSLLARVRPEVNEEECTECGKCAEICKEEAIEIKEGIPIINYKECLDCGSCIKICPTEGLTEDKIGWSFAIGGKLGRHPQFAVQLTDLISTDEVIAKFKDLIELYLQKRDGRKKLGVLINRIGVKRFKENMN